MWRTLRQLDQLFSILKGLTQFLHTGLHSVHPVDALKRGEKRFIPNSSKAKIQKSTNPSKRSIRAFSHLHLQRPSLNLRDALGDDEGNTVTGTAGYLSEISAKQLQTALQLLMTTLDRQSLQTALVARQEALRKQKTVNMMTILLTIVVWEQL